MSLLPQAGASLWEWRGPQLWLLGLVALSIVACFLPLADHLGYEAAQLVALYAGVFGAAPGVAAARRELVRQREGRDASAGAALLSAMGFTLASLLIPVVLLLLNGLRRPSCDRAGGLLLFLALPVPSALLASALGVLCAFASERLAGWLYGGIFAITLVAALWPVAAGPQVFAFHHLGGFFPGPIYDEAVSATPALWIFRADTLLWTLACCGAALMAGPATGSLTRGPRLLPPLLLGASLLGAIGLSLQAERLHWKASTSLLDGELGGRIETPHFVLHVPREKKEADRALLAQQAEGDLRTVRAFLGLPPDPAPGTRRIEVFFHRSAADKRRLIGAADTSFTKPWLRQIHTNDEPLPHRVLRHEVAHAAAAEVARGPFRVPGRLLGLLPDMALIEGLAVAADWPGGEFTVHEQAAALRALQLAPETPRIFRPGLFYAESGARAYTLAGSFVRWLWFTRGPQLLVRAYAGEPLAQVYGPLEPLAEEHGKYLAAQGASARAQALLAQRFRAPGIVRRSCPHEVALLAARAREAQGRSDPQRAVELWRRCAALEPDDPEPLLGLRRTQLAARDFASAQRTEEQLLAHAKLGSSQRASLLVEAGDAALKAGDPARARFRWVEAQALPQWEAQERGLQARLATVADPAAHASARKLFGEGDAGPLTWLLLARWQQARPDLGLPPYLLAKQMQNHGDWPGCLEEAQRALQRPLPSPLFVHEALRMKGLAAWHLGELAVARAAFTQLKQGASPGRLREAEDWLGRLGK
jgi:hypothetical protein